MHFQESTAYLQMWPDLGTATRQVQQLKEQLGNNMSAPLNTATPKPRLPWEDIKYPKRRADPIKCANKVGCPSQ